MSMKKLALFFIAAIAMSFQAPGIAQTQSAGLTFSNTTFNLGMPRSKAVSLISEAGYIPVDIQREGKSARVAITRSNLPENLRNSTAAFDNEGILYFQNGILVRIMLDISGNASTERDLAFLLYGATQRLEKAQAANHCAVRTDDRTAENDASIDVKTVSVICPEGNANHAIHLHWVTSEKMQQQLAVTVLEELW